LISIKPMAFVLPTFNLTANLYTGAASTWPVTAVPFASPARLSGIKCCIVFPVTPIGYSISGLTAQPFFVCASMILFPALTDVRGLTSPGVTADGIECPAGSHRWYGVVGIEDRGKGHPNEHRVAVCFPLLGQWPAPAP
jgi:hypothetical protein